MNKEAIWDICYQNGVLVPVRFAEHPEVHFFHFSYYKWGQSYKGTVPGGSTHYENKPKTLAF